MIYSTGLGACVELVVKGEDTRGADRRWQLSDMVQYTLSCTMLINVVNC